MNLMHFLNKAQPSSSFFSSDQFPLDDELIADAAINAMLLIMNNSLRPAAAVRKSDISIADYAPLVAYGVRFPWKERISFGDHVDLINDGIPDCAVIGRTKHGRGVYASAVYATRILGGKIPKFSALANSKVVFRAGEIKGFNKLSRQTVADRSNDIESVVRPYYAAIMQDGSCVGCDTDGKVNMYGANILSYVICLHNDKKYFWDVTAQESYWDGYPARAHFSIDEEYIKSLFYARSLPMTEKGRMRPILHWVRSHKRRLREGVDIDVGKHLRGIDSFEMHGVNFSISSPTKTQ
jgi:hypothetical protein